MTKLPKGVVKAILRRINLIYGSLLPWVYNWNSRRRNARKTYRCLEIGPGQVRIEGFETLDIVAGQNLDYVADASRRLPFNDGTFDLIYASHVLEHIPWYRVEESLIEWVRVLKQSGHLELWVPDGVKICKAFVDAELSGASPFEQDPWLRLNSEKDPCKWASGRLFTYGDGAGNIKHPNWHRAIFSRRYLYQVMKNVGLNNIRRLDCNDVRGYDHGWINLGMRGTKNA